MLILTRGLNQVVRIGHDITITICGVRGGQVRVGVTAPKEISVHREEVYERIQAESESPLPPNTSRWGSPDFGKNL